MNTFEQGPGQNIAGLNEIRFSKLSQEEQVKAVEEGKKPIATASVLLETSLSHIETIIPLVNFERRGGKEIATQIRNQTDYIYYRPDQEFNAHRMRRMMEDYCAELSKVKVGDELPPAPKGPEQTAYHREIGKLLGYSDAEIEEFVKNYR